MDTYKTVVLLVVLLGVWSSMGVRNFRHRDKIPKKLESITPCFLAEYATWRKLEQIVLFVHKKIGMMDLVRSMSRRGVMVGLKSMTDPQLPSSVHIPRHRLGAIILVGSHVSPIEEEFLEQVSQKQLFHAYVSWLVLTKKESGLTVDVNSTIEERLKYLNIGPDTELVIATLINRTEEQRSRPSKKHNHSRSNNSTSSNDDVNKGLRYERDIPRRKEPSYGRRRNRHNSTDENNDNWNPKRKSNKDKPNFRKKEEPPIPEMKSCLEYPNRTEYAGLEFSLSQVYKIRPTLNTTLISSYLGSWNVIVGTSNLVKPTGIEQHRDFQGQPLIVGIKNATQYLADTGGSIKNIPPPSTDDEMEDDNRLMDLLDFITRSLNATYELVPFTKLGWRNEEKAWLFMLGAVTSGTVDMGLDNVVITNERSMDMFFTLPIVQSMKNIYFRRPESSAMRDIFLAPFSPKLLLSVAVTGIIIATAMLLVNVSIAKCENKVRNPKNKSWSLGEAMVWSVSVLCMQGSSWNPKSPSGCLVLIFSLCFALVIYNAYAAFITSVLSVRVASIRGLGDLLESDFQFGYTLRGQDESFLRTVNDTALRRLYFRGLVRNHGVAEASAGLQKASTGGYAFFVSARLARKALNSFIAQDKRCDVQELTVEATKSAIALPMGLSSPYRRLINLSLLRMREAGVLGPIQERMLPPMPPCKSYSAFNSASITDVYSAFLVFGGGLATAVFMGLSEKIWKRRASLAKWIVVKWANKDKVKILFNEPEPRYPIHTRKRSRFQSIPWFD